MATPSDVSVGLAHELTITAAKAGWVPKDFAALAHSEEKAREILAYLRGLSEIRPVLHAIDCDADPFIPNGLHLEEHHKSGVFVWDPAKVTFYTSIGQIIFGSVVGNELRKDLATQPVLNVNVLDFLLAHPYLIPEDWKHKYVFFWGTIYRGFGDHLSVRYLQYRSSGWGWSCAWLTSGIGWDSPALVLAR